MDEASSSKEHEMQSGDDETEKRLAIEAGREAEAKHNLKLEQREQNLHVTGRPDEDFFRTLDGSVKKNSTFIKKLRTMTEQQKDSLTTEFKGLNLTRYIQEAASAVAEAKLKLADIGCATHMCTQLHQRYAEFSPMLLQEFEKHFQGGIDKSDDKSVITSKYRLGLRLVGELTCAGVFVKQDEALSLLISMLQGIIQADEDSHTHLPVILSFARHCAEDIAGVVPRKQRLLLQKYNISPPKLKLLSEASQSKFHTMLQGYFLSVKKCLLDQHKELHKRQRKNQQILQNKGELSDERKEENEKFQKGYDKLLTNVSTLADILDEDMPDLPEQHIAVEEETAGGSIDIQFPIPKSESEMDPYSLWEDDDTRVFYECLTDLKTKVPAILYDNQGRGRSVSESASSDATAPAGDTTAAANTTATTEDDQASQQLTQEQVEDPDQLLAEVLEEEGEEPVAVEVMEEHDEELFEGTTGLPNQFSCFVEKLPTCMSKQMVDEMAIEFCMNFNSKPNRKKLVQSLFSVSRNRMDLISYYARLVATLNPILTDIALLLVEMLIKDFKFQVYKKDQTHIQSKLKTCKFIAELTKFGLCSKPETMRCLTLLLRDFSYHNIEMTCVLLEHCGRYLYRSPDSHPRAKALLEIIIRKKDKQHLDGRQMSLIENALYYTNPPVATRAVRKQRPPLQEFMRKLLYKDLNRANTEKVLKMIRKFPWTDAELSQYGVHCFTNIWKVKFNNIDCAANLLAGLASYQEDIVIRVVDAVLEDIRLGLELPVVVNQRRISSVKFLGELYNYQLIDAALIFRVLYLFISFGCRSDGTSQQLDPADSYSRARLVCILLDTCGQYFEHGSSKKKLDSFLVFFQCYLFNKRQPLPLELEYRVSDLIELLRPGLALFENQPEAIQAAMELEKLFKDKLGSHGDVVNQAAQGEDSDDEDVQLDHPYKMDYEDMEEDDTQELDDDDDDDEMVTDQQQSDDEEAEAILKSGPKHISSKEDDDFMAEYEKMLSESQQGRANDLAKVPMLDVAIPMQLKGSSQKGIATDEKPDDSGAMEFKLLMKKGHKQMVRDLKVPLDSELAIGLKDTQMARKHEQKEMKRLILNYEQRQLEEEIKEQYQGAMLVPIKNERIAAPQQQDDVKHYHGNRGGQHHHYYHHHHGRQRHHHTEY